MITSNGRKKSVFPASVTVPDGATFDYVTGGTNYKITKANLLAALGVTGSLTAVGASGATPVLAGTLGAYLVRGIEDGAGITCSVSAENGITIANNFSQDGTGTALVNDLTADSPAFASLVGGSGITISKASNVITITASNTTVHGLVSLQPNATATTIAAAGTPVLTAGTWVAGTVDSVTASTAGRLTYTGSNTFSFGVDASLTIIRAVNTGVIDVAVYLAKNGAVIAASKRIASVSDVSASSISLTWQLDLQTNDFLEVWVANEDGTDNILVSSAVLRMN